MIDEIEIISVTYIRVPQEYILLQEKLSWCQSNPISSHFQNLSSSRRIISLDHYLCLNMSASLYSPGDGYRLWAQLNFCPPAGFL